LLVIACGAIARELVRIKRNQGWDHIDFQCLPPSLHNHPEQLTAAVENALDQATQHGASPRYEDILVAYGDCGTGGQLDAMLQKRGVQRLPGAHCYEFFSGSDVFEQLAAEEPGSFYLTDFLVQQFDRLVIKGLALDRYPQLLSQYFGNYRRVVYLAQNPTETLQEKAQAHAAFLGLDYEYRSLGDQPLTAALATQMRMQKVPITMRLGNSTTPHQLGPGRI
jgi:hypothetical protein